MAGDLGYLFTSGWMSILFWAEILIGVVIPMVLFSFKRVRQSPSGLLIGAIMLLFGMILNRFNVSWFAVEASRPADLPADLHEQRSAIFPTLPEVSVSIGHLLGGHPGLWPGSQIPAGV